MFQPDSFDIGPRNDTSPEAPVIAHYRKYHSRAKGGKKERELIQQRLREGFTVEDMCLAIDGCHVSDFHKGKNDRYTKYQSLELIFRDASHVNNFMDLADAHEKEKKIKARKSNYQREERQPPDVGPVKEWLRSQGR